MRITRKFTAATAVLAIAGSGTAIAAQAPTLGPLTVIKAGQKSPIDVAGNDLPRGATIRKGTELRRWTVTMHGPSNASVTLKCGSGARHVGLGLQEGAKVVFVVVKGSEYRRQTIKVRFYAATRADADGARASVYALCKKS